MPAATRCSCRRSLHWSASSGSIDGRGSYRAGSNDANISVRIGDTLATTRVTVGSHGVALPFAQRARFVTAPPGGAGGLTKNAGCGSCVATALLVFERRARRLRKGRHPPSRRYDRHGFRPLRRRQRRTRARSHSQRNQRGRLARRDAFGESRVAPRERCAFPPDAQATRLVSIYVLPQKGVQLSDGSIVLRNVRAIVAGH